tara:strand:+ start:1419 stop:1652 length:234 start_codon:yes stop_codon:yes gene_type:complete
MILARRDLAFGSAIGGQSICNDPLLHKSPTFHAPPHSSFCGALVSLGSQDFFKNDAVLIGRPPQPEGPACDLNNGVA